MGSVICWPLAYVTQSGTVWLDTTVSNLTNSDGRTNQTGNNAVGKIYYTLQLPAGFTSWTGTVNGQTLAACFVRVDDTDQIYFQVFKADRTTALTNRALALSNPSPGTFTSGSATLTPVSNLNNAADWAGCVICLETTHSKNKGDDNSYWQIDTLNLAGDAVLSANGTLAVTLGALTCAGTGSAQLLSSGSLAVTLGALALSGTGAVTTPDRSASLGVTLDTLGISAGGTVANNAISASLNKTLSNLETNYYPSIRGVTSNTTGATDTTGTVGVSIAVPAETQEGDRMFMIVQGASSTGVAQTPSGWSVVEAQFTNEGYASSWMVLYTRRAFNEPASYDFHWGTTNTGRIALSIVTLINGYGETGHFPDDGPPTASDTLVLPSLTAWLYTLAIGAVGSYITASGATATWTEPGDTQEVVDICSTCATKPNATLEVFHKTYIGQENSDVLNVVATRSDLRPVGIQITVNAIINGIGIVEDARYGSLAVTLDALSLTSTGTLTDSSIQASLNVTLDGLAQGYTNIIPNGDLEEWSPGAPTGWSYTGVPPAQDTGRKYTGAYSAGIIDNSTHLLSPELDLPPGEYHLSFWSYGNGDLGIYFNAYLDGSPLFNDGGLCNPYQRWEKYEKDFTVPSAGLFHLDFNGYDVNLDLVQIMIPTAIQGIVQDPLSGTLGSTLADVSLTASGTYTQYSAEGTLSQTLGELGLAGTAKVDLQAQLAVSLDALTCVASGQYHQYTSSGSLALTMDELTGTSEGDSEIRASASLTLAALDLSALGTAQLTSGNLAVTLETLALTATGTYTQYISQGTLASTLADLSLSASGTVELPGTSGTASLVLDELRFGDILFNLNLETGDLSQFSWSDTTQGPMTVEAEAALNGTGFGLKCNLSPTANMYAIKDFTVASNVIRFRFLFDPHTSLVGDEAGIAYLFAVGYNAINRVMYCNTDGNHPQIFISLIDDYASYHDGDPIDLPAGVVEIDSLITRASSETAHDASYRLWFNGIEQTPITGIDIYDRWTDTKAVGIGIANISGAKSGILYEDELLINASGLPFGEAVGKVEVRSNLVSTLADLELSATGTYQQYVSNGTLSVTLDGLGISATGTHSQYQSNGSLGVTLGEVTLAGTGTYQQYTSSGSLSATLNSIALSATGIRYLTRTGQLAVALNDMYYSVQPNGGFEDPGGWEYTGLAYRGTSGRTSINSGIFITTWDSILGGFHTLPPGKYQLRFWTQGTATLQVSVATGESKPWNWILQSYTNPDSNWTEHVIEQTLDYPRDMRIELLRTGGAGGLYVDDIQLLWLNPLVGSVLVSGTSSSTLDGLGCTASGALSVAGAADLSLGELLLSATGTAQLITGTLGITLDGLTLASVGEVVVNAVAEVVLEALTLGGTGVVPLSGVCNVALDDLSVVASGSLAGARTGTLSVTLEEVALSATAKLEGKASLELTLGELALSGTGTAQLVSGVLAQTLEALGSTANGQVALVANLSVELEELILIASSQTLSVGSLSRMLDELTLEAGGVLPIVASVAVSLDDLSLTGTGVIPLVGALTASLEEIGSVIQGKVEARAVSNNTLEELTLLSAGEVPGQAVLTQTLLSSTLYATGELLVQASLAQELDALSLASEATAYHDLGQLDATLASLGLIASGQAVASAELSANLDELLLTALGIAPVSGSTVATLDELLGSASAQVDVSGSLLATLDALTLIGVGGSSDANHALLIQTLADLSADVTGVVALQGTFLQQLEELSSQSQASLLVQAQANVTLESLALSGIGGLFESRIASLDETLEEVQLSAIAKAQTVGQASATLGELECAAQACADILGSSGNSLAELTLSASGTVVWQQIIGSLSVGLTDLGLSAQAGAVIQAQSNVTLGSLTLFAQGSQLTTNGGTLQAQLDSLIAASSGTVALTGHLTTDLAGLQLLAHAAARVAGQTNAQLADAILQATGVNVGDEGDLSGILEGLTVLGNAKVDVRGLANIPLGNVIVDLNGKVAIAGQASLSLTNVILAGNAGHSAEGQLSILLSDATVLGTGWCTFGRQASLSVVLDNLGIDLSGEAMFPLIIALGLEIHPVVSISANVHPEITDISLPIHPEVNVPTEIHIGHDLSLELNDIAEINTEVR